MSKRARPKWLDSDSKNTTRAKSKKQETIVAKLLKGHVTINSGATLGQNDVVADFCEVECKTTSKDSFSITKKDWSKLVTKCKTTKIPMMVVTLEGYEDFAVVKLTDLKGFLDMINHGTTE